MAGEAVWRHDPLEMSGVMGIGMATTAGSAAAAGPRNDHDKDDKTGDEPCHHPQPKPLIRFHRFSKKSGVGDGSLPRSGPISDNRLRSC
jgi:hypothetical protein